MSDIKYAPEAVYRKIQPLIDILHEEELNLAGIVILKDGTWIVINDEELNIQEYIGFLELAKTHIYRMREC